MDFEWDPAKRERNLAKHGVDFVAAVQVFAGSTLERADARRDYGEQRIIAIGTTADRVLTIVYTMRGTRRRIISARVARSDEKAAYRALQSPEASGPDRLETG